MNINEDEYIEQLSSDLFYKVKAEYTNFIENLKNQSAEYIIESAHEIVWKDNITQFIETESPILSIRQYVALLSANNTLGERYLKHLRKLRVSKLNLRI